MCVAHERDISTSIFFWIILIESTFWLRSSFVTNMRYYGPVSWHHHPPSTYPPSSIQLSGYYSSTHHLPPTLDPDVFCNSTKTITNSSDPASSYLAHPLLPRAESAPPWWIANWFLNETWSQYIEISIYAISSVKRNFHLFEVWIVCFFAENSISFAETRSPAFRG